MTGTLTPTNLAFGFFLSYLILGLTRPLLGTTSYFGKSRQLVGFFFFFCRELVSSSLRVGYDILTPTHRMRPAVLAFPTRARNELELTLVSNVISLTPGSLTLDVSQDGRWIYIHVMYLEEDLDLVLDSFRNLEAKVLDVLR